MIGYAEYIEPICVLRRSCKKVGANEDERNIYVFQWQWCVNLCSLVRTAANMPLKMCRIGL